MRRSRKIKPRALKDRDIAYQNLQNHLNKIRIHLSDEQTSIVLIDKNLRYTKTSASREIEKAYRIILESRSLCKDSKDAMDANSSERLHNRLQDKWGDTNPYIAINILAAGVRTEKVIDEMVEGLEFYSRRAGLGTNELSNDPSLNGTHPSWAECRL